MCSPPPDEPPTLSWEPRNGSHFIPWNSPELFWILPGHLIQVWRRLLGVWLSYGCSIMHWLMVPYGVELTFYCGWWRKLGKEKEVFVLQLCLLVIKWLHVSCWDLCYCMRSYDHPVWGQLWPSCFSSVRLCLEEPVWCVRGFCKSRLFLLFPRLFFSLANCVIITLWAQRGEELDR